MVKRMLIDAAHPEEMRVVVVDGTRLEEFDVETSTKKQLKGNIYLAKVIRVEPSLQAAFVDYGNERHGFLPFSEIHPDYYQIPVADREALKETLMQSQRESARKEEEEVEKELSLDNEDAEENTAEESEDEQNSDEQSVEEAAPKRRRHRRGEMKEAAEIEVVREGEETHPYRSYFDMLRKYKIQEVIRRNQILLVQVVKEERGNKGAALTTYLSLAGRYCVLMPNNARGGGVSRKISNIADRHKLKAIVNALPVPEGMSVILRTAGRERTKLEIKRDYEYLIKTWVQIRDMTMASVAPCLIHEEGNLIRRSIRDIYTPDISEILIEGESEFKAAKDFVKMIIPSHAKKVICYKGDIPLFHRYQVETQLEMLHNPIVQLKSGGYLVINPTEALVAIDVNSGRSTREHSIEDTALKTNLEAVEEVARQLRLRDLAGLIVIDLIDMEEPRNNVTVERRMREVLRRDRARIQLARINGFGLMEISRQRLHSSFIETSYHICPHCQGTGVQRSIESVSVHILRLLEEEASTQILSSITITVPSNVALYILNHKRNLLTDIEKNYDLNIVINGDDGFVSVTDYRLEKTKKVIPVLKEDEYEEAEEDSDEITETEESSAEKEAASRSQDKRRRQGRGLFGRRRQKYANRRDNENHFNEEQNQPADETVKEELPQAETVKADEAEVKEPVASEKPKRRGRPRKIVPAEETALSDENTAEKKKAEKEAAEPVALPESERQEAAEENKDKSLVARKTSSVIRKAKGAIILFSSHNFKQDEAKSAEKTREESETADEKTAVSENTEQNDMSEPKKRRGRKPKAEKTEQTAEAVAEDTSKKADETSDAEPKKKKGGWWSRAN